MQSHDENAQILSMGAWFEAISTPVSIINNIKAYILV